MSAAQPDSSPPARRRPRDRKAQIARASADAFGAQGYHAVSMEEIASRVGISPAALYRHSPSKYDLFRDAVLELGQQLVDATAFADAADDADPADLLDALVTALIDTTLVNRTAGGLYRWEARYLRDADKAVLQQQIKVTNRRLHRPLARLRPKLKSRQLWTLSSAAMSVIGSITDHSTPLAANELRSGVTQMATDLLHADLPAPRSRTAAPQRRPDLTAAAGTYELVLHESMRLFSERGYRDTSMDDIATAVGMPPSGIYRYFPGKADILAAACRRAADRISRDVVSTLGQTADPEQALIRLVDLYVARSFAHPEVAYLYHSERHNLSAAELFVLDAIAQSTVDAWARLVTAARPERSLGRARYAVHAASALIVDLGRLVDYEDTPQARATARRLMEVTLLGLRTSK